MMKRILVTFVVLCAVFLAAGCTTKNGTIYLATKPPGATVYVDKIKQGETPLEFQWNARIPATLTIEKEGYDTETERLDKGWLVKENHKGNYDKYYQPVGDTSQRVWRVRTSRDLVEKKQ